MTGSSGSGSRNDQRKAATWTRIVHAGERLFAERGYSETSMNDIAVEAEVAPRTLYLHFESKAAILMAFFEAWLDAYVEVLCSRDPGEPLTTAAPAALRTMSELGYADTASATADTVQHPLVSMMTTRSTEVDGRMAQIWFRAQQALVEHYRPAFPEGSLVPRLRAALIQASWSAMVHTYTDVYEGRATLPDTSYDMAEEIFLRLVTGIEPAE